MTTIPAKNLPFSYEKAIDDLLGRMSAENRDYMRVAVSQRRNEPQKERSIYSYVLASQRLDECCGGRPFAGLEKADYVGCLEAYRSRLAVRTLRGLSTHLKVTYRDTHNTDALPRDIRKALSVKVPKDAEEGVRVVSDDEFKALLGGASAMRGGSNGVPTATMWTALLWVMMDGGLRASELLGLRVGDIEVVGDGRYLLHLRADGRVLKTGPRVVPVSGAVPALAALLSVHPHSQDERSHLFQNMRKRGDSGVMKYLTLNRQLTRLANATGVNAGRALTENVTPHDFRHSCATQKARQGWQPLDLMKFFGWTTLKMAMTYVHMDYQDIAERVARDAGLVGGVPQRTTQPLVALGPAPTMDAVEAMIAARVEKAVAAALAKR